MGSAIGGNLETSIIFDASGLRTGTERAIDSLSQFEGSAERVGQSLRDIGNDTAGMTATLERAANMVELLSLKMLAMDKSSAGRGGGGGMNRISAWQSWMAEEAGFLQKVHGEVEQQRAQEMSALSRDIQQRLSMQQGYRDQWAAEEAGFLQRVHNQAEQERSQDMAALRRDIETRNAARVRGESDWAADQARLLGHERQEAESARSAEMADLRRDIETRNAARVRGESDWAADQARLLGHERNAAESSRASEMADLQRDIQQRNAARVRGEMDWISDQARLLAIERNMEETARAHSFAALRADMIARSAMQHNPGGTAGMRRFAQGSQQLGYAIEDATSVYGTMGMAGAFRAGGNNLTAMAAAAGPWIGVAASLAAAAAAVGLHMWESSKATESAREEEEKLNDLRQKMLQTQEHLIESENRLTKARSASTSAELQGVLGRQMQEADKAEAIARDKERNAPLVAMQARIDDLKTRIAATPRTMQISPDLVSVPDAQSEEAFRLANEGVALKKELLELQKQELAFVEKINSEEFKAEERAEERLAAANRSSEIRRAAVRDLRRPAAKPSTTDLDDQTRLLDSERSALINEWALPNSTEDQQIRRAERLLEINREAVEVWRQLAALQKEGVQAEKDASDLITGRFEALNPELAIQNEILRTRTELNQELQTALRAGEITFAEANQYTAELERAFSIEQERRDIDKDIDGLKDRERELEDELQNRGAPAGLTGAVTKGSEEAIAILEQERLRQIGVAENEPVVTELKQIREEIKRQQAALERLAGNTPGVAMIL